MSLGTIGTIAALGPFIEYLRPSRSPYLLMVIFGCVSLILTSVYFHKEDEWFVLAAPQFLALIAFSAFSYYGRSEKVEENQEEQLRFSRAFSIISALLCLAIGSKITLGKDLLFYTNYFACIIQLTIFSLYVAARLFKEEKSSNFNFFQFSFITSIFLISATVSISFLKPNYIFLTLKSNEEIVDPFFLTAIVFYSLWVFCQVFWAKRVAFLVRISVSDE